MNIFSFSLYLIKVFWKQVTRWMKIKFRSCHRVIVSRKKSNFSVWRHSIRIESLYKVTNDGKIDNTVYTTKTHECTKEKKNKTRQETHFFEQVFDPYCCYGIVYQNNVEKYVKKRCEYKWHHFEVQSTCQNNCVFFRWFFLSVFIIVQRLRNLLNNLFLLGVQLLITLYSFIIFKYLLVLNMSHSAFVAARKNIIIITSGRKVNRKCTTCDLDNHEWITWLFASKMRRRCRVCQKKTTTTVFV